MLVGSRQRISSLEGKFKLQINNISLSRVQKTKCLGLEIDEYLTWEAHIKSVTKKVVSTLAALRKIRKFTSPENLVKVYKSVIEPYFDYCSIVWDTLSIELTDKLQRLQNRAARIITGATYNVRSKNVLEKLEWLPLKERRVEQKAIMMYKIVNNLAPKYMVQMFENNHGSNYYNLRNSKYDFQLPKCKTEYYGKSFAFSGAKVWNSLPNSLRDAQSLKSFKKQLRKHLHQHDR